jgi:SAM-dependent methyltransferase
MSVAPDGSPVALYAMLAGDTDAARIHGAIPPSAPVLELGCGAGRVSRHLVARGHAVTGVDNSEAMLSEFARSKGTEAILADIASLDLGRTWPAVVLASHMVNGAEANAFLQAAAHHLSDDGVLLVQRHEPGWVDAAEPTATEGGRVAFELADVDHRGPGVVAATAIYTVDGTVYRQAFVAHEVDDPRLAAMAASAGLGLLGYVENDPSWVRLGRIAGRTPFSLGCRPA